MSVQNSQRQLQKIQWPFRRHPFSLHYYQDYPKNPSIVECTQPGPQQHRKWAQLSQSWTQYPEENIAVCIYCKLPVCLSPHTIMMTMVMFWLMITTFKNRWAITTASYMIMINPMKISQPPAESVSPTVLWFLPSFWLTADWQPPPAAAMMSAIT